MHPRSASALARITVTALLLLAVSPVTASFLTADRTAPVAGSTSSALALVQPKTTHDQPVPAIAVGAAFPVLRSVMAPATAPLADPVNPRIAFLPPLRM
jgi:hypothetical protein